MRLRIPDGRWVKLTDELGLGAEAFVFSIQDTSDLCAKLYLDERQDGDIERIRALMRQEPRSWGGDHAEHLHVAWPLAPLEDERGRTRGFLMPRVDGVLLQRLFDPAARIESIDEPTWRQLIAAGSRVARLFDMLHRCGIVVGDVSPQNILISRSGHATLIDCDSVQFFDNQSNRLFPATKLTPEYSPPERGGIGQAPLSPDHDVFALAVLVCELLMEGQGPFDGVPKDNPDSASKEFNIRNQNNWITTPERLVDNDPSRLFPDILPPDVLVLAQRCFGEGYVFPTARPRASEWLAALDQAGFELMGCRRSDRHLYHVSQGSTCPWCARVNARLGDHFPPSALPLGAPGLVTVAVQRPPVPTPAPFPPPPTPPAPLKPAPRAPTPKQKTPGTASTGTSWGKVALILILLVMAVIMIALVAG